MAQIVSEFQATHVAAFGSTGTKNILQFHLQKFIYKCAIALAWRMQREGKGKGRTWGLGVKGSNSGSRNQEAERGSGLRKTNGIKEENQILLECHWQQPTATTATDSNNSNSNNNKRQQPTTTTKREKNIQRLPCKKTCRWSVKSFGCNSRMINRAVGQT